MPHATSSSTTPPAAWITAPIPLLAFLGTIVEGIIAILAYSLREGEADRGLFVALIVSAITLPLVLVSAIFRLITRHHGKLYAPFHFARGEDFLHVLNETKPAVERLGQLNRQDRYRPFSLAEATSSEEVSLVGGHARRWQELLAFMTPEEFITLHAWYNEIGNDPLALLCLDIAIAKGMLTSKNFSFRSANLRHMGRLSEAKHSAELALELDGTNTDAHYNLAKILVLTGNRLEGEKHAKHVLQEDRSAYASRLRPMFPDLVPAADSQVQRTT